MDSPGYAVVIVEMSICLPLGVKVAGFALPWPRPGLLCQLKGIVSSAINLNLHFKMELVAPGRACHAKKVVQFGESLRDNILYPVPHRQYVFTIPIMCRLYFKYDRGLLTRLCHCAYESLLLIFPKHNGAYRWKTWCGFEHT